MESTHEAHVLLKSTHLHLAPWWVLSSLEPNWASADAFCHLGFHIRRSHWMPFFLQIYPDSERCNLIVFFPSTLCDLNTTERGSIPYVAGFMCVCAPTFITFFLKKLSLTATKHFVPFNIHIKLFLRYARLNLAESIFKVLIRNRPQLAGHSCWKVCGWHGMEGGPPLFPTQMSSRLAQKAFCALDEYANSLSLRQ